MLRSALPKPLDDVELWHSNDEESGEEDDEQEEGGDEDDLNSSMASMEPITKQCAAVNN